MANDKFEPKIVLPADWICGLDENGHPFAKLGKNGPELSLRDPEDEVAILAMITERLNSSEEYKKGREQIFLRLLIAQAYREGVKAPAGAIDPYEQDSLTLAIFLWILNEKDKHFKGNTHELRKKVLAKARTEDLDASWWPKRLNWFSKAAQNRAERLGRMGVRIERLTDGFRSWQIGFEERKALTHDAK